MVLWGSPRTWAQCPTLEGGGQNGCPELDQHQSRRIRRPPHPQFRQPQPGCQPEPRLDGPEGRGRARRCLELLDRPRSEEHTSELQSLMRISYAVFCLKKKKTQRRNKTKAIIHNNNKKTNNNKTY